MDATPVSLLERVCKHWDQDAWVRFVQLYSPLIFKWGQRCGLQTADAADLAQDVFATLFEHGPQSVGTALFARQGRPPALSADDFSPMTLRRGIPGQSGTQWFFTEAGRPFSFYAVLGSYTQRGLLVPRVNEVLGSLTLSPAVPAAPTQWN